MGAEVSRVNIGKPGKGCEGERVMFWLVYSGTEEKQKNNKHHTQF